MVTDKQSRHFPAKYATNKPTMSNTRRVDPAIFSQKMVQQLLERRARDNIIVEDEREETCQLVVSKKTKIWRTARLP